MLTHQHTEEVKFFKLNVELGRSAADECFQGYNSLFAIFAVI